MNVYIYKFICIYIHVIHISVCTYICIHSNVTEMYVYMSGRSSIQCQGVASGAVGEGIGLVLDSRASPSFNPWVVRLKHTFRCAILQ